MKVKVRNKAASWSTTGAYWEWAIFANNGTALACSEAGYSRKGNALRAAKKFVNACKQGKVQLEQTK